MKRSITIAGHRTSLSLEQDFWDALVEIARTKDQSIASLVAEIDEERLALFQAGSDDEMGTGGLSSALRLYVLRHFRDQYPIS